MDHSCKLGSKERRAPSLFHTAVLRSRDGGIRSNSLVDPSEHWDLARMKQTNRSDFKNALNNHKYGHFRVSVAGFLSNDNRIWDKTA